MSDMAADGTEPRPPHDQPGSRPLRSSGSRPDQAAGASAAGDGRGTRPSDLRRRSTGLGPSSATDRFGRLGGGRRGRRRHGCRLRPTGLRSGGRTVGRLDGLVGGGRRLRTSATGAASTGSSVAAVGSASATGVVSTGSSVAAVGSVSATGRRLDGLVGGRRRRRRRPRLRSRSAWLGGGGIWVRGRAAGRRLGRGLLGSGRRVVGRRGFGHGGARR